MITVGIIKEKFYDNETLIYKVDLPIFKSPGVKESSITTTIIESTASVAPGTYEPYNIEDQVYVGFVNNELGQPVILGKIAKKFDDKTNSSALNYINSLKVTNSAILPKEIKIGDITYDDLYKATIFTNNLLPDYSDTETNSVLAVSNGTLVWRAPYNGEHSNG